jgi:hypothetical protein
MPDVSSTSLAIVLAVAFGSRLALGLLARLAALGVARGVSALTGRRLGTILTRSTSEAVDPH